jgi:hypothetical protein
MRRLRPALLAFVRVTWKITPELVAAAGVAMLAEGAGEIFHPLRLVVAGAAALAYAILDARSRK